MSSPLPVFVVSKTGKKLKPTTRFGKVRHLLQDGKAKVYSKQPFTIQLQYDCPEILPDLEIGIERDYIHVSNANSSEFEKTTLS